MISVVRLTEELSNDTDKIITILDDIGASDVTAKGKDIRFAYEKGSNKSANIINIDTLRFYSFSSHGKGNIFTLIMDKKNINFNQALKYVCSILGLSETQVSDNRTLPFSGFYRNIKTDKSLLTVNDLQVYDDSVYMPFQNKFNTRFFKDGIDYTTQHKFNIGYDFISNRITIPQYSPSGELVGIVGRLNSDIDEYRWLPLIPCSNSQLLYGFHINYHNILNENICYIGESPKFVMQLDSMRINTALATCTNKISTTQADILKTLKIDKIILCFDEGLDEEFIKNEAGKLKSNNLIYRNQIGYIYDKENHILKKGSKDAPSDLGRKNFISLATNYIKWID